MASPIVLMSPERLERTRRARRLAKAAADARQASLILLLADGMSWDEILERLANNFSVDENKKTREFLSAQQKVRLHLMPAYSSWLKQVELWILRIVRDELGVRKGTPDTAFRRKLMDQVRLHNSSRLTLRWNSAGSKER